MNAIWFGLVKFPGTKPYSALPVKLLHQPGDARVVTLEVPGFRQVRNYSCGYTAALMVLRHFGCRIQGAELFNALGTTRDGTGQNAIVKVLREQELRANLRYDMDFARMRRCIDLGKLLIAYLADEQHWIVIYGYGEEPRRLFVADPEPEKVCEYVWDGYGARLGGFAIVCSPRTKASLKRDERAAEGRHEDAAEASPAEQLSFDFGTGA